MIKVSVMYPAGKGTSFDMDYYLTSHIPMVKDRCGALLQRVAVEGGVCGATAEDGPTYSAMGHLYFETVEDFQNSFGPHADEIMGDIPNYSSVQPVIQISEVKM